MFGKKERFSAVSMAGGLLVLVVLARCGAEESVATRSAAAFREAQQKGKTFEGTDDSHGHGATTPGAPQSGEEAAKAHDHDEAGTAVDHSAMEHDGAEHAGQQPGGSETRPGGGHAGMNHGQGQHRSGRREAAPGRKAGQDKHAGHAAPDESGTHAGHAEQGGSPQASPAGDRASGGGHARHSLGEGNSAPNTVITAPVVVSSGNPAAILVPDPLDAPAVTSVLDAQLAAEMSGGGSHGNHGGTYSHVDAGRDANAPDPHRQHSQTAMQEATTVYACPMHPEVTSTAPGECSKCGMALVERREE